MTVYETEWNGQGSFPDYTTRWCYGKRFRFYNYVMTGKTYELSDNEEIDNAGQIQYISDYCFD